MLSYGWECARPCTTSSCVPRSRGRLVSFYRTALEMDEVAVAAGRTLCHGPERRVLIARGPARTLNFAAYAASAADVVALAARCRGAGVELLSSPSPLFAADAIALRDPEGR